ncbi:MAG TPA: hypothetical protein DCM14_03855, partial [Clostridiales bacterium UBA8153]|nr:hypothetical protein [Clostridiales bacterium UBA8153]
MPVRAAPPGICSPLAIQVDATSSGRAPCQQQAGARVYPASATKFMTLVVALEAVQRGRVAPGSANDAGVVVAEHIAGSEEKFVIMMNERAAGPDVTGARLISPHGSAPPSPLHHRTGPGQGRPWVCPGLLDLTRSYCTTFRQGTCGLDSCNRLVRTYPGSDGLKTGGTGRSGFCLLATAKRDERRFVAVARGAETAAARDRDSVRLSGLCLRQLPAPCRWLPAARYGGLADLQWGDRKGARHRTCGLRRH